MKVFGVGMIKTGTTTLGSALQIYGFRHLVGNYNIINELAPAYICGNWKIIYEKIDKFESFDDYPFCAPGMVERLDKKYPNSKYILTERDPDSWYDSLVGMLEPKKDNPSLFEVSNRLKIHDSPYGHLYGLICFMLASFETIDLSNKDQLIKKYLEHNTFIKEYFKNTDQLLVVNWLKGDGWKELSKFFNFPTPKRPFPHRNKNIKKLNSSS